MVILNPEVFDSGTGSQVDVDASAILEVAEDRTQVSYSTSELVKSGLAKLTNVLATHGDYNKEQEGEQNYSGVAEELKQKLDAWGETFESSLCASGAGDIKRCIKKTAYPLKSISVILL